MEHQYDEELAADLLRSALDVTENDEARFHIRQALQHLPNENFPENDQVFGTNIHG